MPDKRILLVEDDEDVGALLAVALEGDGYEVDLAKTAAESWARLAAQAYALVIADWGCRMAMDRSSPTARPTSAPRPSS